MKSRRPVNFDVIRAHMTVAVETPASDIFEGCGNGTLHIYVARVPGIWNANVGDRHIPVCVNEHDWQAIFFKRLHSAEREPYVRGEDTNEWRERNRRLFAASIPEYPMLGRIFDMYEDYTFSPDELSGCGTNVSVRARCHPNRPPTLRCERSSIVVMLPLPTVSTWFSLGTDGTYNKSWDRSHGQRLSHHYWSGEAAR